MDGNGRWAKRRLLPRVMGHRAGLERMLGLVEDIFARGIGYCTLFALSAENLGRSREELEGLYALFSEYFTKEAPRLKESGVSVRAIGDLSLLPPEVESAVKAAEKSTAGGSKVLTIALAYGGRQDIVRACNRAVREGREVTVESLASMLSTGGMPEVDLLIRTGKEKRISNFLLFESAYAELYFTDKLFPDFTKKDLDRALGSYAARERRFGVRPNSD